MSQNTFVKLETLKELISLNFTDFNGFEQNEALYVTVTSSIKNGKANIDPKDLGDLATQYSYYPTVSFALQGKDISGEYPNGKPETTPTDHLIAGRAAMLNYYFEQFTTNKLDPKQAQVLNHAIKKYPDINTQFKSFRSLQAAKL